MRYVSHLFFVSAAAILIQGLEGLSPHALPFLCGLCAGLLLGIPLCLLTLHKEI